MVCQAVCLSILWNELGSLALAGLVLLSFLAVAKVRWQWHGAAPFARLHSGQVCLLMFAAFLSSLRARYSDPAARGKSPGVDAKRESGMSKAGGMGMCIKGGERAKEQWRVRKGRRQRDKKDIYIYT